MKLSLLFLLTAIACAAPPLPQPPANRILADYFAREVAAIEAQTPLTPSSMADWQTQRADMQRQLAGMLGLDPMPERTPLHATQTGELALEGIVVEKLHFQSMPGLYVTGNLFRPAQLAGRLPTILYVCGHSDVKGSDGTSLGNKTHYQHHGAWFARHGYVCLVIDTVQLGEIRGDHHGTYRLGRWWWMSRGYTPAGIEAWNGMRALDYLVSRPDVDPDKLGITGRSGGGAYSWWIAALDDRIKVAAPTAGITTLKNHVVDGAVEGHCDCMFMVNTLRWDYDRVASLLAPRPLLIANTDKDTIFPLDGVISVYSSVRRLYKSLGAEDKIGLQIAEGPHKDTQPLNVGAFAWFERFLKGADSMATFDDAAKSVIEPEKLRVFTGLPTDERNTRIDAEFVPVAHPQVPAGKAAWDTLREGWMHALREQVFNGWPHAAEPLALREVGKAEHDGVVMRAWDFTAQEPFKLRIWIAHRAGLTPDQLELVVLNVLDAGGWRDFTHMAAAHFAPLFDEADRVGTDGSGFDDEKKMYASKPWAMAYAAPRGIGPTAWSGTPKDETQRLRRFYLLGQTLDGMQVWDIRRSITALRAAGFAKPALWLQGERAMGVNALYASLFEEGIARIDLHTPPASHMQAPIYLNVLRHLDTPQAVAMAAARGKVRLYTADKPAWSFATETASHLGLDKALELRDPAPAQ